jgi:hypothetical protein
VVIAMELTTKKAATEVAGSLGFPSKMPGTSYGLPAAHCVTGRILAAVAGTICATCYAFERGNYRYGSVRKAQAKRLEAIRHANFVEAMVLLLERAHGRGPGGVIVNPLPLNPKTGEALAPYHRWHDSGDLQSRDHLARICAVARATPWLDHWCPSREAKLIRDFVRDGGTIPANLTIRLSATMIDGAAPRAWPQTSTVHNHSAPVGHACPAPQQGNKCGDCRACWSRDVATVAYHIH